jgi:hypothetical protein
MVPSGGLIHNCTISKGFRGSFKNQSGKVFPCNGADIYIYFNFAINVNIPDGMTPILETLEILQREVSATINVFKSEFK